MPPYMPPALYIKGATVLKTKIANLLEAQKRMLNRIGVRIYVTYLVTITLVMLSFSLIMVFGIRSLLVQQVGGARLEVLKLISERANSLKSISITVSNLFGYDDILLETINNPLTLEAEFETKRHLARIKENFDIVFADVGVAYDVFVLGENGFNYSSQTGNQYHFESIKQQLWYHRMLEDNEALTFVSSFQDVFTDPLPQKPAANRYVFSAAKKIFGEDGSVIGVVLINLDEKLLSDLASLAPDYENNIYIVDARGNIVSHSIKSMLGLNFINVQRFEELYGRNNYSTIYKSGENYLLTSYYDQQTGWTIISEVPGRVIFKPLYMAYSFIFLLIALCFLFALLSAFYSSRKISQPILKLCHSMAQMKEGNFTAIDEAGSYEEIELLKTSFNEMALEIQRLMEEIKVKEANKRKSELDFLRAQINPHFLYNTLFSIQCLIETRQNDKALYMMAAFIDLLKKTLTTDSLLITLAEEYSNTQKYLVLQQCRYGDKISFEMDLDEGVADCMVPALLLQPVVENAIFHGLEAKTGQGMIIVEAHIENDHLLITVTDDGIGMNPQILKLWKERKLEKIRKQKDSLGLANVFNRIKINFGEAYGISIESSPNIGTAITCVLPVIQKEYYEGTDTLP